MNQKEFKAKYSDKVFENDETEFDDNLVKQMCKDTNMDYRNFQIYDNQECYCSIIAELIRIF